MQAWGQDWAFKMRLNLKTCSFIWLWVQGQQKGPQGYKVKGIKKKFIAAFGPWWHGMPLVNL